MPFYHWHTVKLDFSSIFSKFCFENQNNNIGTLEIEYGRQINRHQTLSIKGVSPDLNQNYFTSVKSKLCSRGGLIDVVDGAPHVQIYPNFDVYKFKKSSPHRPDNLYASIPRYRCVKYTKYGSHRYTRHFIGYFVAGKFLYDFRKLVRRSSQKFCIFFSHRWSLGSFQ